MISRLLILDKLHHFMNLMDFVNVFVSFKQLEFPDHGYFFLLIHSLYHNEAEIFTVFSFLFIVMIFFALQLIEIRRKPQILSL